MKRATADREDETKLDVPSDFVLPPLAVEGLAPAVAAPPRTLTAVYFDGPSLALARQGVTLRFRRGEGRARWTLKLPAGASGHGLQRDEISVVAPGTAVPDELADLLTPWLRGVPLRPVATLTTRRTTVPLRHADGTSLGELVDDRVTAREGERRLAAFRELEVEAHPGGETACRGVVEALVQAGARGAAQTPKLVRALGAEARRPPDLLAPPKVSAGSPSGRLVLSALRRGARRVITVDAGVRRDEDDAVHQLRVACRRLRSDLKLFAPLVTDDRLEPLRQELRWLGEELGAARDLEVLRERLAGVAANDPLAPLDPAGLAEIDAALDARLAAARVRGLQALRSARYVNLLRLLVDCSRRPALGELAEAPCKQVLPRLVGSHWSRLAKRARGLGQGDPDARWHQARIAAKRARYAAEAAAPAVGRSARRTAGAAASLQELLGAHQDAAVAAETMLELARDATPLLAVTAGRLAERERSEIGRIRRQFPAAWQAADRTRMTSWLA